VNLPNLFRRNQIDDASIIEQDELAASGMNSSAFRSGLVISSVVASTKTITFVGSGLFTEPRVQPNDIINITTGTAAGRYLIATVVSDTVLTVVETISNASSGGADIYYRSGAFITGFESEPTRANGFTSRNVQLAIEEAKDGAIGMVDFDYNDSLPESSTSSTSYQQKVRLNISDIVAGDYIVMWSYELRAGKNAKRIGVRVQVNDSLILTETTPELRDHYLEYGGFEKTTLPQGNNFIDLDYKKIAATAYIRRARICFWRTRDV